MTPDLSYSSARERESSARIINGIKGEKEKCTYLGVTEQKRRKTNNTCSVKCFLVLSGEVFCHT